MLRQTQASLNFTTNIYSYTKYKHNKRNVTHQFLNDKFDMADSIFNVNKFKLLPMMTKEKY